MVAGIILTAFTRVTACTQFVHSDCQCLMSLDAQCAKAHGTCYEVLHNALNGFYLSLTPSPSPIGEGSRYFLEAKEITQENGRFFFIY